MKIGVLIDRLNVGGVEKSAIQEVRAMKELGEDVTLLVLSRRAVVKGAHKDLLKGIKVEYLDDRLPKFLRATFRFPMFAFFSFFHLSYALLLPFFVKSEEYDYILSHGSYTSFTALTLRKVRKIPYSIYFWDPGSFILRRVYGDKLSGIFIELLDIFARLVDKVLVSNSDYIFAAGDTHNDYFVNICKVDKKKIIVVNPGTPIGKPTRNKDNHVLMVTTWKEGKHPEYIFEIIEKLPKIKIKMVGGWIDKKMLKDFKFGLKKRGYSNNVEILGEANEKQLAKLYTKALVHLTTNLERGFGMPVLEAAACGTTFVVPKGSGVCSVFKDKKDGYFSEERDTKEIVGYIEALLKNKDKAIKMGQSAFLKVKKGYSWEAHSKKILNAISKLNINSQELIF